MAQYKATINIISASPKLAALIGEGIQNVLDELGENQEMFLELADKAKTRKYAESVRTLMQSSIVRKLLGL
jgi:hypothetical protein